MAVNRLRISTVAVGRIGFFHSSRMCEGCVRSKKSVKRICMY